MILDYLCVPQCISTSYQYLYLTTSLFSLTGIMVNGWEIIPKWPNYSG